MENSDKFKAFQDAQWLIVCFYPFRFLAINIKEMPLRK